jgi:hypothetical protein
MITKRYYYLVRKDEVVYDMIKYSMISCGFDGSNDRSCVVAYKENLRCIKDVSDPVNHVYYIVIPMEFDFSTPFKGEHAYTVEELKEELKDVKWEHNNDIS